VSASEPFYFKAAKKLFSFENFSFVFCNETIIYEIYKLDARSKGYQSSPAILKSWQDQVKLFYLFFKLYKKIFDYNSFCQLPWRTVLNDHSRCVAFDTMW
jgi:hypothetical protein